MITETDELAEALDRAALRWPELRDDRAALLRRILSEGAHHLADLDAERRARRFAAIRETSGSMSGVWPADAVERMRAEWPE
jgi:hypothetical protein